MLISSCSHHCLPLTCTRQLETTETDDITAKFLEDELYPKTAERASFAKPARPGRGRARMAGGTGSGTVATLAGDDE